jgi:hypothetical protein
MSNYTYSTNFGAKDALNTGDPNKLIKGVDFDTEFNAISTAIATKADLASPTFTGTVTIPTAAVTTLSLDGTTITATGTELNRVDVSAGIATPSKALVLGSNDRIRFNDNYTVTFGTSNDLQISHDGTNSNIKEYVNPLNIDGIGVNVQHSGSTKLATSTTGVTVTGEMSATTLSLGNWVIKVDTNELVFEYNSTEVFKVGTNGAITSANNVTAYGTI